MMSFALARDFGFQISIFDEHVLQKSYSRVLSVVDAVLLIKNGAVFLL